MRMLTNIFSGIVYRIWRKTSGVHGKLSWPNSEKRCYFRMPHGFTLLASNCNASGNESTDRVEMRKDVVMEMHYRQHLQWVSQGAVLTDDVLRKISEVQELDPFRMRIARLQFRHRRQHTHLQPFTGPVVDNCPVLTGGLRGHQLLCS
jgi:hypothetical protein